MEWKLGRLAIVAPKLTDPRLFMICVLTLYTLIGQTVLAFDHNWSQIFTALGVSCVLDTALSYWKTRQIVLPVSGLITGMSLGLLVEAIPLWPYIVAPVLAIGAKAFIQFKGHHLFNPSNFGLTVLLILAPATVTTLAAQWSGSMLIVMLVLLIGGFTSFRVSRWDLVLSFIAGFSGMALVEQLLTQRGLAFVYGPVLGAAFQIFAFSMLTDPKTTPETRRMRLVFGLAVAVLDGVLRLVDVQNSPFIALLCISATVPLFRAFAPVLAARKGKEVETEEPAEAELLHEHHSIHG